MGTLLVVIGIVAVLLGWLVWLVALPLPVGLVSTVAVLCAAVFAELYVFEHDRPILPPSIESIVFVNSGTANLGLDMEVLEKNRGLLSGFADGGMEHGGIY